MVHRYRKELGHFQTYSLDRKNISRMVCAGESIRTRNSWLVSPEDVTLLETCNNHEVDTRIVRHVSLSDKPVVIVAADTDVLSC